MARWAHTRKVEITDASVDVEFDITLEGSGLKGDAQGNIHEVRITLDVQSPAPRAEVDEVIRIGRNTCFMEKLITNPVPLVATVRVNGEA